MKRMVMVAAIGLLTSSSGSAAELDLAGKFTFNWLQNPARTRCAKIGTKMASDLSSSRYRCKISASRVSSGKLISTCASVQGRKEYLVFDTRRECEEERKTQVSNSEE